MNEETMLRRENFNRVVSDRKLSIKDLMAAMGRSYSFWYDLLNDPKKSFGEKNARMIEAGLVLPRFSLDELADQSAGAEVVRLTAQEREIVQNYRKLSKEARQLDLELSHFGAKRSEAYGRLLEEIERLRTALMPAATPSVQSGGRTKTKQARARKKTA